MIGCDRPQSNRAKGLCSMHVRRLSRTGKLDEREPQGRCSTSDGYVRVFRPNHPMAHDYGWVLEHRLVAYEAGWLTGPEDRRHVHHRNGIKSDNRPGNLQVVTPAEHGREHWVIDWDRAEVLYRRGWTTIEVAAELGTFPGNVSRRLRERGVKMRRGKEATRLGLLISQYSPQHGSKS